MADDVVVQSDPASTPVGRPPWSESTNRRETILRLKEEGLSQVAIAKELGVTPAAVNYHIKKARAAGQCA